MGKKLLYLTIFVILSVVVLIWLQQDQAGLGSDKGLSSGQISALEGSFDFGTISMADGKLEHSFQLKNESAEAVELKEIYTSCMCTTAQVIYSDTEKSKTAGMRGHGPPIFLQRQIKPGETFEIRAIFDPSAHGPAGTGPVQRVVYLKTNSKLTPVLELSFKANVTP